MLPHFFLVRPVSRLSVEMWRETCWAKPV